MANEHTGDHKGAERAYRRGLDGRAGQRRAAQRARLDVVPGRHAARRRWPSTSARWRSIPKHVKSHNNLALALVELGQLEEAAEHFETSLALEPKAEIYSDLGFIMARLGKSRGGARGLPEGARARSRTARRRTSTWPSTLRAGGRARRGRVPLPPGAARDGRPPRPTTAWDTCSPAKAGRTRRSRSSAKRSSVDPKFTPAYNNLAEALAKQGKLDEAATYYRRSLAEKPSAAVYNALGAVLRKLGRSDEAADGVRQGKGLGLRPSESSDS